KFRIVAYQGSDQKALVPFELIKEIRAKSFAQDRALAFFKATPALDHEIRALGPNDTLYYIDVSKNIIKHKGPQSIILSNLASLPKISFESNWLLIVAAHDLLVLPIDNIAKYTYEIPSHRLELVAIKNNIAFYNDSKSTVPQALLAAVESLQNHKLILLLGGKSKGVDRRKLIAELPASVNHIVCFGVESETLHSWCKDYHRSSSSQRTLEEAFSAALTFSKPGDTILLSPSGSSHDLFKDYQERGNKFKELVLALP
ncbi:MAG TPA: cyanophycin synthetase, partial [Candidatus Babeliaceae bacterium]|nr:cyanophycin synthetase [Candidatus Babeliaceae bacterium]